MYKPGFEIEFSDERLITPSGLSIIGGMLGKSNFIKHCNRIPVDKKRSEPQIKNGDILLTYIGLLCQGKTEYDTVREMQDDPDFYKTAIGHNKTDTFSRNASSANGRYRFKPSLANTGSQH